MQYRISSMNVSILNTYVYILTLVVYKMTQFISSVFQFSRHYELIKLLFLNINIF